MAGFLAPLASIAIGAAPHIIRQFAPRITAGLLAKGIAPKVASRLIGGTQVGLLGGQFLMEQGYQEEQQIADLMEQGYDEETAKQIVKANPLKTALRSVVAPGADAALLAGKMPGAALLAGGIQVAGGALQGLDSGINRGYDAPRTLAEIVTGGALGAIPPIIDSAAYIRKK